MKKSIASMVVVGSLAFGAGGVDAQCSDSSAAAASCVVEVQPNTAGPSTPTPAVAPVGTGSTATPQTAGQLPVTGSDAGSLALFGGAMVVGGAVLVYRGRRTAIS